jgi:YVTN family beta-propeller protein
MRRFAIPAVALLVLGAGLVTMPHHLISRTATSPDFVHFEGAHVHPVTLTPGGARLLVVNTPDNRVSVFDLTGAAPARIAEIPVGLEPVSVACLDDTTAWVVNQLSDDVSVVNLRTLHVEATLRVGDEPADVVFAGTPLRAYVSVAQENRIRIYDPANLSGAPTNVAIAGRMPRALARSADGAMVYAAVFNAGNRTSLVNFGDIPVGAMPVDPQFPRSGSLPPTPPRVALIVQRQGAQWKDMYGGDWTAKVPYNVPDVDVAEITTATNTVTRTFGDLGSVNFGLAVNPIDGRIAVSSTEALNLKRFEPRLRGHIVDTQLGLVTASGVVTVRNLNPHADYNVPNRPADADSAIGIPTGVAYSLDGQRVYVTSLASNKLAVLDPAGVGVLARVSVVAGPTGVVADAARGRLYIVGRFRNQLQTLSAVDFSQLALQGIGFDPTPDVIVNGRRFFYGGQTSGHGDQACATCHVFGDFDNLAWDLGDPNGTYGPVPPGQLLAPVLEGFDPMKGPMTTQSLRGLPGTGILHWRGDRANLAAFNPAFVSLMGTTATLPDSAMAAFTEFVMPLAYPPNPHQHLDRTFPDAPAGQPSAKRGREFFLNTPVDGGQTCNFCHAVPTGTNGQIFPDDVLLDDQDIKVPQLRNLYKKTGFSDVPGATNQRGFGFTHDGGIDNLFDFLLAPVFNFAAGVAGANQRRDVEAFLHAFDTGIAPAVGYQVTFDGTNNGNAALLARIDTLRAQIAANADVIAKGRLAGQPRGWLYLGFDQWQPDKAAESNLTTADLIALAARGSEVTLSGVPFGSGDRMGIDRDRDTYRDGDELDAGSDPGNPASTPLNVGVSGPRDSGTRVSAVRPNPFRDATELSFALGRPGPVSVTVYDVLGREVRSVARGLWLDAGPQSLRWDGRTREGAAAVAGVYFVRLDAAGGHWSRVVVRVR